MRRRSVPADPPAPETFKDDLPASEIDNVAHYDGTACLEAIRAQLSREEYIGWLRGTIAAYQWRLGKKGPPLVDAQKSRWYQDRLIEVLAEEEE